MKSERGRGGIIKNIYIENVTMKNIERQAINVNSYYSRGEEKTGLPPTFQNIHIRACFKGA